MRKLMFGSALGLSIVAGSMATATPASAALWRNFGSNNMTPLFLSIPNSYNTGQPATLQKKSNLTSQMWPNTLDPVRPGNIKFVSALHPPPPNTTLILGVSAGIMTNGRPIIDWVPKDDANQSWSEMSISKTDDQFRPCVVFVNAASPPDHTYVMSVSGSVVANAPVVIRDFDGKDDQFWCFY